MKKLLLAYFIGPDDDPAYNDPAYDDPAYDDPAYEDNTYSGAD